MALESLPIVINSSSENINEIVGYVAKKYLSSFRIPSNFTANKNKLLKKMGHEIIQPFNFLYGIEYLDWRKKNNSWVITHSYLFESDYYLSSYSSKFKNIKLINHDATDLKPYAPC